MIRGLVLVLALLAGSAQAGAPTISLRPVARPAAAQIVRAAVSASRYAPVKSLRPIARNTVTAAGVAVVLAQLNSTHTQMTNLAVSRSLRPYRRTSRVEQRAEQARVARLRGQVCGDPDIQGDALADINGSGACGINNPVRVRSILGVRLRGAATIDCNTARALKTWIARGALPAVGSEGGGVASLRVVSDYSCRTRNSQPGAKLSEHAFGRAIDIAGIGLANGSEMSVLRGWGTAADGAQLRQMHRAACGPFGTVLGPDANSFHRDHFHFDTAQYRSGSYCR